MKPLTFEEWWDQCSPILHRDLSLNEQAQAYADYCVNTMLIWENSAASIIARFITLSSRPDEQEWGAVAAEGIRLLNEKQFSNTTSDWDVAKHGPDH